MITRFDGFHGAEIAGGPEYLVVFPLDGSAHAEAHKHHLGRFLTRLVPYGIGRNHDVERFGVVDVIGGALRNV